MKNGCSYQWKYHEEKKLWNGSIVGRILKNELYVGNTVFHKKETAEVGSRRTKCLPKEEWKVCEGTHEPIISKELFELVNNKDFKKQNIAILTEKKRQGTVRQNDILRGRKKEKGKHGFSH